MWSRDVFRRSLPATVLAVAVMALGGCGFQPVHGNGSGPGSNVQGFASSSVDARLAAIEIAPAEGRVGQKLRNELIYLLNRGGDPADSSAASHVLHLRVRAVESQSAISTVSGRPRAATVNVTATYNLVPIETPAAPRITSVSTIESTDNGSLTSQRETVDSARANQSRVVQRGTVFREASLDWVDQRFANDRARIDAEDRAATELANDIYLDLAGHFAVSN